MSFFEKLEKKDWEFVYDNIAVARLHAAAIRDVLVLSHAHTFDKLRLIANAMECELRLLELGELDAALQYDAISTAGQKAFESIDLQSL